MWFRYKREYGWSGAVLAAFGIGFFTGQGPAKDTPPVEIQPAISSPTSPPIQASEAEMVVHVVGRVKNPGIYKFAPGKRIQDALDAAGGLAAGADADALNLAQPLEDGVQVRVPEKGAVTAVEPVSSFGAPGQTNAEASPAKAARPAPRSISLNTASAAQLDGLPGVGPATAAKIIEYRKAHGGFASIDELLAVKGIGPKKLQDMRPYLRL